MRIASYLLKLELDWFGVGGSHCLCNLIANFERLLFGGSLQEDKHAKGKKKKKNGDEKKITPFASI